MQGIQGVIDMSAGSHFTCARHANGRVTCWGQEHLGPSIPLAPRDVPWLRDARQLAIGEQHSCALMSDDRIVCWGNNRDGQLGDGTTTASAKGVTVLWPQ